MLSIIDFAEKLLRRTVNRSINSTSEDLFGRTLRARTVKEYFTEFPFVICLSDSANFNPINLHLKSTEIGAWCKENEIRFVTGIHQVIWDEIENDWVMNSIAGEEKWFWAFRNEQDAIMFALRWV